MTDTLPNLSNNTRKDWRKLVKKLRRKKIRQKRAIAERGSSVLPSSLNNSDSDEVNETDEEERKIAHEIWLRKEEEAQKSWREKEMLRHQQEKEKVLIQERIRQEWEAARAQKLEKKKAEERKQDEINTKIMNFINTGGPIPEELCTMNESNPGKEPCPFFSKVAACRFGPACSRNHVVPGISTKLLIPNFYSHFTLYHTRSNEYDTDVGLEFEDSEMNRDFREFFEDIVLELERMGELRVLQVCRNSESHLRGNVYMEYMNERDAMSAARALNARWYGGRQLAVCFVNIQDWGAAICGDFHRGRCPKGNECNFLHTFRNPSGRLMPKRNEPPERSTRSWRWSESPPRTVRNRRTRSRSRERRHNKRSRSRNHHERRLTSKCTDRKRSRDEESSKRERSSREHSKNKSQG